MTFSLPVPPSANRWHRSIGRGRVILSAAARAYLKDAATAATSQGVEKIAAPQDVAVSIVWYRAARRGDCDKRGGVLLDAIQGIAYDNDSQIRRYAIERDDSDRLRPRMEITISPFTST